MIEFNKISIIKILILVLLTLKISSVLLDNFQNISTEITINSCPDEIEVEVESKTFFFQKINKNAPFTLNKIPSIKAPVFKNTFSDKILHIEFTTPPPEKNF